MSNPFIPTTSQPGNGTIHLALLPPGTPRLRTLSYQYPLKLVTPAPSRVDDTLVHTVYLLTYGGGLVAGDQIDLHVIVESDAKLVLLTQGSTKLFKTPSRDTVSRQRMTVDLAPGAALCYLPDPVQPFERSCFEQQQIYNVICPTGESVRGSLCVLDWASNGRPANGENWSFFRYGSRNEVYLVHPDTASSRLLLRDNVLLDDQGKEGSVAARMDELSVFGTLILYGPLFTRLGQYFMDEFKALPRIGGRKWDSGSESGEEEVIEPSAAQRLLRQHREAQDRVLWSAATLRGCVVVKFGAGEMEGGRSWLRQMLLAEGTVGRCFGERALLCLR